MGKSVISVYLANTDRTVRLIVQSSVQMVYVKENQALATNVSDNLKAQHVQSVSLVISVQNAMIPVRNTAATVPVTSIMAYVCMDVQMDIQETDVV